MLFNSIDFIIFFIIYIFFIYFFRKQWKKITIIFSIFFYSYWNIYFCLLLIAEALFTWYIGYLVFNSIYKKISFVIGLIIPILILFVFKYFNFFVSDILKIELQNTIWDKIILPIGISFYTFQAIMYIVDLYNKKFNHVSLKDFLVFYLFFPNLIAGPLVRPKSFLPQIQNGIFFSFKNLRIASIIILWGYFLKLCVANNLSVYVFNAYDHIDEVNSATLFTASIFYSFLIYSDFAGYSLISIGIAKLLGFNIPANFNNPFNSINLTSFWRRWHISLSSFLKDYLYIVLGGNRFGLAKSCRNIMIVMVLGGIWHGASFNFIIWGILHGFYLSCEKIFHHFFKIEIKISVIKKIYTFILVTIIFIPFGLSSFDKLISYYNKIDITKIFEFSQILEKFYMIKGILLVVILMFFEIFISKKKFIIIRENPLLYGFVLVGMISLILCFGNFNETSFIYFQF